MNITPGINDNGYLIYAYNMENNAVIDMEEHYEIVAHNRKCHERMRLDEPVWATMNATFPDGTVCPSSITLPFIPGERAEITVRNGSFDVTGSKFYREYAAADILVDNARKYNDRAQRDSVCVDYFRQHAHEEGCVVFYLTHNICHEQIQPYIPASFTQSELRYFMNH